MPTPSPQAKKQATAIESARRKIEDAMIARAVRATSKATAIALRTSNRANPMRAWKAALGLDTKAPSVLHKLLLESQVESYRAGYAYAAANAAKHIEPVKKLATFSSVSSFLKSTLNITSPEVAFVRAGYSKTVNSVIRDLAVETEAKLTDAMLKIADGDLPTNQGTKALRKAFEAAGVDGPEPYQIETVFRTQTMAAWQVGAMEFEAQPHIDDEIWGYEYLTAGDDRVRPEHAKMDGVRAPKDDPIWDVWTPPCGYSCRCIRNPIFKNQSIATPTKIPDAKPEPAGFIFNPATLYADAKKRKSA